MVRRSRLRPVVGLALGAASLSVLWARTAAAPEAATASGEADHRRQESPPEAGTIRAYSNIVIVDVVVTDSKGNPVRGLKASDFTLLENNQTQAMKHFEEYSALPASETRILPAEKLPPGLFTNQSPGPANGPVNVLLLDYLNTPLSAQPFARKQLLEFLDKAPAGTRIAIFALTNRLSLLQGFTSDMSALKAALTSKQGAPQASDILLDPVFGGTMNDTTMSDVVTNGAGVPTDGSGDDASGGVTNGLLTPEVIGDIMRFEATKVSATEELEARYTLNAFDQLARYLVGISGRKNVIWFSGGFPLDVEPSVRELDPNDSVVRNDEDVRRTDNLLTRAQVSVYPVDARGLFLDPANAIVNEKGVSSTVCYDGCATTPAQEMGDFDQQTGQEQESMYEMAEDTGGEAFVNTNGLMQAVSKAIAHGSNYYTLTYAPSDMQWDGRFRTIKIKVPLPNLKLSYRNGYYAVDPNDRNRLNAQNAATALTDPTTMATAMMHGGPDATEILFKVRIRPADGAPAGKVLSTNQVNPKLNIDGPYRQYGVDLVPDPHAVSCRMEAGGNRHCAVEVWTFVYDAQGEKLITASNRVHRVLTPADYARLLAGGLAFHQEISVPVKGKYYLRTAIHDLVSDRVGAVEIPVAAVARLGPLEQVAASGESTPAPASPAPATAPGR